MLDEMVCTEKKNVEKYIKKSEQKIADAIEETAQKLRISQVLKVLPYNTIDSILSNNKILPRIIIDKNHPNILLDFEYGQNIVLAYSNYQITLSPETIEVEIYGASKNRKFTSFPVIKEAYEKMAYKLMQAIKSF
jgi:hypothetical protein